MQSKQVAKRIVNIRFIRKWWGNLPLFNISETVFKSNTNTKKVCSYQKEMGE